MTVRLYKSTDASAPVLTGQAGALLTVLDAVLVDGYGAISGAGWSKAFAKSGNIGIYRMATSGNTGFYLHVDDSGTNNTVKEAIVCGAESASALNTITGQFPTAGQLALITSTPNGGVVWRKSNTADATARPWIIIASDSTFYIFIDSGDFTMPPGVMNGGFGDFFSYKASDPYRCMIFGRNAANGNSPANDPLHAPPAAGTQLLSSYQPGQYLARHWTGVGGSCDFGKHWNTLPQGIGSGYGDTRGSSGLNQGNTLVILGNSNYNAMMPATPNSPDGNYLMSPIWIHHHNSVRGYFKGLWAILHAMPFGHGDTMSGVGNMSGKSFIFQVINGMMSNVGNRGLATIEYSDTWS